MSATSMPPEEDPNYYRILYQLAAQNLSAATDPASQGSPGRVELLEQASFHAEKLRTLARNQLRRIDARPRSMGHPFRGMAAPQGRLQEFLAATVVPCADLVIASVLVLQEGKPDAGERELADVRRRVGLPARAVRTRWWHRDQTAHRDQASARTKGLSSRVYYSLACYEGRRAAVGCTTLLDDAFAGLEEALRRSDGTRRAELGRWAQDDPALHELVYGPRCKLKVTALLDAYAITVSPRMTKPPTLWWRALLDAVTTARG